MFWNDDNSTLGMPCFDEPCSGGGGNYGNVYAGGLQYYTPQGTGIIPPPFTGYTGTPTQPEPSTPQNNQTSWDPGYFNFWTSGGQQTQQTQQQVQPPAPSPSLIGGIDSKTLLIGAALLGVVLIAKR